MTHLNIHFDRDRVRPEGGSVRYLIADVTAPTPSRSETLDLSLDLGLVIDVSGSMSGAPLESAKEAAAGVVRQLRPEDRLTLVVFASDVHVLLENVPMDPAGVERALNFVAGLETRDCTNLSGGWLAAGELLASITRPGRRRHVVLLSDGFANRGIVEPAALAKKARDLLARGVSTTTVGIGDRYSTVQLQAIAEHGGGRLHDAERPHEIVEVVTAELRELDAVTAEDVKLELRLPPGFRATCLTGYPSVREGALFVASLGSLCGSVPRRVVLRVDAPQGTVGERWVVEGCAQWRLPGEPSVLRSDVAVTSIEYGDVAGLRPSESDAELVTSTWQSNLVQRVTELNRDGAFDRIDRLHYEELPHFERYASFYSSTRRYVDELHQLMRRARRPFRERSRKEMALFHHKAMRGDKDLRHAKRGYWLDYGKE